MIQVHGAIDDATLPIELGCNMDNTIGVIKMSISALATQAAATLPTSAPSNTIAPKTDGDGDHGVEPAGAGVAGTSMSGTSAKAMLAQGHALYA